MRERTFPQATPMGELVIVTLEGEDPITSFATMVSNDDEFTRWFIENANAAHGMDLSPPMPEAPSTLMIDSEGPSRAVTPGGSGLAPRRQFRGGGPALRGEDSNERP